MDIVDTLSDDFVRHRRALARLSNRKFVDIRVFEVLSAHYFIFCQITDPDELCEVLRTRHGFKSEPKPGGGIHEIDEDNDDEESFLSSSSSASFSPSEAAAVPAGLE